MSIVSIVSEEYVTFAGSWADEQEVEDTWTCDDATAAAVTQTAGMDRARLIARLTFIAPALTDEALRALVIVAMTAPQRTLDRETLGAEQRAREARP